MIAACREELSASVRVEWVREREIERYSEDLALERVQRGILPSFYIFQHNSAAKYALCKPECLLAVA